MVRGERGFTFIEVVVVMAVLGLLIWVALPRSYASDVRLHAAARQLQSDIRYAQELAMIKGQRHQIRIYSASNPSPTNRYEIVTVTGGAVPHPLTGKASFVVDFNGPPWAGLQLDSTVTVEFDSLGRPNTGGTVSVSLGSGGKVITIDPETGRVVF